jgi:hypothetical protein
MNIYIYIYILIRQNNPKTPKNINWMFFQEKNNLKDILKLYLNKIRAI